MATFIRWLKIIIGIVVIALIGMIVAASYQNHIETAAADEEARKAGFADSRDRTSAQKLGFSDPAAWKSKIDADKAKEDADRAAKAAAAARQAEIALEAARNPADRMSISNFSWEIGGFGSVAIISLTVQNDNNFTVKDILIACSFDAPSGTTLSDVTHTIYDSVKPKSKRTFAKVNVGFIHSQSRRANCRVILARRL